MLPVGLSRGTKHFFLFLLLSGLIPVLLFLQLTELISISGPLYMQLICLELSSPMLMGLGLDR